jgi:hypothetical protein
MNSRRTYKEMRSNSENRVVEKIAASNDITNVLGIVLTGIL